MSRPPRARSAPLLSGELVWHVVLVSILIVAIVFGVFAWSVAQGHSVDLARTMAFNTLVVLEVFHLFFVRNIHGTSFTVAAVRGTPVVWLVLTIIITAQVAVTYAPPLQRLLGTEPVPLPGAVLILAAGVTFFLVMELEKHIRLSWRR